MRKAVLIFVVLLLVPGALYAQRESEDGVRFGIPLLLSGHIPTDKLSADQPFEHIHEFELHLLLQSMFGVGNSTAIGPEIGISYPPRLLDAAVRSDGGQFLDIIRLPVRFVVDFEISESGLFHIQLFGGLRFSFWAQEGMRGVETLKNITFDVGGRFDIAGVTLEVAYTPPYRLDLDPSASANVPPDTLGIWDDHLHFSIGYLFRI